MTTNIKELTEELYKLFDLVKEGTICIADARIQCNVAGKIIAAERTKLVQAVMNANIRKQIGE